MSGFDYPQEHSLHCKGRIGNRGTHHDWVSRDYADIDCKATGCKFNICGSCATPSRAKIGPGRSV